MKLLILVLLSVLPQWTTAAPLDPLSPEDIVMTYIDARNQNDMKAMLSLRDFRIQAIETLSRESPKQLLSEELIAATAKRLEYHFRSANQPAEKWPRTCADATAHYESPYFAKVLLRCKRTYENNLTNETVFFVRVTKTLSGWRVVDSSADH
jgi:hypothetical protein